MESTQYSAGKSNVSTGIIGALIFGVVGVALWVFLGTVLNIISTAGVIVVVGGVYGGYTLFRRNVERNIDKKGIMICFILTLILSVAGIFITAVFDTKSALEETYSVSVTLSESFHMLVEMLKVPEGWELFADNFIISGVLLFAADVIMAVEFWKKS